MNHDELLAKINAEIEYYDFPHPDLKALRAVVELHKPTNGYDKNICLACSPQIPMAYPCPTIQAIEKELV